MKIMRVVSLVLAMAALCCVFIGCDTSDGSDVTLPERDFYDIKVSFQIKSADGKTVINAVDYNYKGHAEPTVLSVIKQYLTVVEEWTCKVDKTNTLTQIGGMKVDKKNGEYWGFVMCKRDDQGNMTSGALNLSLEQIKKNLSDGKMGETAVQDGDEFTIILIKSED